MVDLRTFIGGLALVPFPANAQRPGKVYTIGLLTISSFEDRPNGLLAGFLEGLQELGYVEGRNLVIKRLVAEFKAERLPGLAVDSSQPERR